MGYLICPQGPTKWLETSCSVRAASSSYTRTGRRKFPPKKGFSLRKKGLPYPIGSRTS